MRDRGGNRVGLDLLVRLLHLLRKGLLKEGGGRWVLLGLGLGGRDGGMLGYRRGCGYLGWCWSWSRGRSWLNGLCWLWCRWFRFCNGSDTFRFWCGLRFGLFGFRGWLTMGSVSRHTRETNHVVRTYRDRPLPNSNYRTGTCRDHPLPNLSCQTASLSSRGLGCSWASRRPVLQS